MEALVVVENSPAGFSVPNSEKLSAEKLLLEYLRPETESLHSHCQVQWQFELEQKIAFTALLLLTWMKDF